MKNILILRVPETMTETGFSITRRALDNLCEQVGDCVGVVVPGDAVSFSTLNPGIELTASPLEKLKTLLESMPFEEENQEQPEIPIE